MKILLAIALVVLCLSANAQTSKYELPLKNNRVFYEGIVKIDTTFSTTVLYGSVKQWFANYFHSAKAVIQLDDKDNNRIIGKGYLEINANLHLSSVYIGSQCYFTIQVEFKKGKYRYQIYDFYTEGQDILGTYFKGSLDNSYPKYKADDYKGAFLYKKPKMDKNYWDAFSSMDERVKQMIESLNNSVKNSLATSTF